MKWAEVIILRLVDGDVKMLSPTLQNLMNDVVRNANQESIHVFRREKIDSDICIVLFHNKIKTKDGASPLGLRLAAALKEVGQVHHTIWNEIER